MPAEPYVEQGVLRWPSGEEVALFGVNYSAPFAYRVHLWDRKISDKQGSLLENEHLRLFDFLMAELKKRDQNHYYCYWLVGQWIPRTQRRLKADSPSITQNKR